MAEEASAIRSAWAKSAPFLPLYHSYSANSSLEPSAFLLLSDRSKPVRSLLRTYASSITTIVLGTKCVFTEKMKQEVASSHFYDYSREYLTELRRDPLWTRLCDPLLAAKPFDFEKEKAALRPENSLSACLDRFSTRGNLDSENKWFCPRCQNEVCAENRTLIDRLPDVLILQLERFEYDQSATSYSYYSGYSSYGARRKINTTISFPLRDLEMRPWLHEASREPSDASVYDLVAICNHSGTSSGGHYYCFAKDENEGAARWLEYNDSSVSDLAESQLVRSTAYVLFYQRRKAALRSDALCSELAKRREEEEAARRQREEAEAEEARKRWAEGGRKWAEEPAQVSSWPYRSLSEAPNEPQTQRERTSDERMETESESESESEAKLRSEGKQETPMEATIVVNMDGPQETDAHTAAEPERSLDTRSQAEPAATAAPATQPSPATAEAPIQPFLSSPVCSTNNPHRKHLRVERERRPARLQRLEQRLPQRLRPAVEHLQPLPRQLLQQLRQLRPPHCELQRLSALRVAHRSRLRGGLRLRRRAAERHEELHAAERRGARLAKRRCDALQLLRLRHHQRDAESLAPLLRLR